jgi:beta-glucosidase
MVALNRLIKTLSLVPVLALCLSSCESPEGEPRATKDRTEERIDSVLALMNIDEKIGQLNMYNGTWDFTGPVPENDDSQQRLQNIREGKVGAMLNVLTIPGICEAQKLAVEESRLGIPMLFGYDIIHGYQTMMPIPLGQASSWDPEVAEKANRVAAREASASGISLAFAPMVDITRDSRWGRIMEGAGEDPLLSSVMAQAWVKGFQGDELSSAHSIAACAKHFAGYGFAESGKEYNTTDMSEQTLMNVVLPPFKAAVDAGVASVMNGFNDLNGIPVTANGYLQRDILKEEWGFDGFVVSDFNSVPELITHGYSPNKKEAAAAAFGAGSDLEMESRTYELYLKELLEEGRVSQAWLDDAVRRVLRIKFRLGLFKDPYKYCDEEAAEMMLLSEKHLETARDVARRSMVLLKNENNILPISTDTKVAVIGELAKSKDIPLGNWRSQAIENSAVSVLEGVQANSRYEVSHAQGYTLVEGRRSFVFDIEWAASNKEGFAEAIRIAKSADVVIMGLGEDCYQTGEGRSQTDIGIKGDQLALFNAVHKVNPNVIVVLMNGRALAIPELEEKAAAIVEAWFAGSESGNAIADILYGYYNPSGKLPVSFPYSSGQEPLYYNHKMTGRPVTNEFDKGLVFWAHYSDAPPHALYPFGYGLSYSEFEYGSIKLNSKTVGEDGELEISFSLTNSSDVAGEEIVQLYIRDEFGSATRPVKELKKYQRVFLEPGETKEIQMSLSTDDLAYYWPDGSYKAEPGSFKLFVGGNSRDVQEANFILE